MELPLRTVHARRYFGRGWLFVARRGLLLVTWFRRAGEIVASRVEVEDVEDVFYLRSHAFRHVDLCAEEESQ